MNLVGTSLGIERVVVAFEHALGLLHRRLVVRGDAADDEALVNRFGLVPTLKTTLTSDPKSVEIRI